MVGEEPAASGPSVSCSGDGSDGYQYNLDVWATATGTADGADR